MVAYVKELGSHRDEVREMARPRTPKSERPRRTWGSIPPVSLQTYPGLCRDTRKCVKKEGHAGDCWPT